MPSPPAELTTLLRKLAASGAEFVLVGGLAAVAQGAPLTTQDVDVVHRRTPENVDLLDGARRLHCSRQTVAMPIADGARPPARTHGQQTSTPPAELTSPD
jgi:hypothetical protein